MKPVANTAAACGDSPAETKAGHGPTELDDAITHTDTALAESSDAASAEDEEPVLLRDTRSPQHKPRKRRDSRAIRWIAAAVIAAVLTGAGYEGWLLYQHHRQDVAAAQALDAAKKYMITLTSVDTNAIDKNFTDVLDGSTGEFKDMYTKSSAQLRQALIDNRAAAHGTVVESAVKSATTDKVEVVLFVDQSVSNAAAPQPQLDRSRVNMTMQKVDGRWLASKVDLP